MLQQENKAEMLGNERSSSYRARVALPSQEYQSITLFPGVPLKERVGHEIVYYTPGSFIGSVQAFYLPAV